MDREETVFNPGDVIADRYQVAEELGRGSYGVVFRAIQLGIGRNVALKTLLPHTKIGSEEHQRFEREALVVSRFNHPNIVTLYDYGEYAGVLFMVMEFVEGRPLRQVIEEDGPMAPDRVRAIMLQMLDALQYAHEQNVAHRDLKPANIQLIHNPSFGVEYNEQVKVLDFGIAKFVHGEDDGSALDSLTQTGVAMGTPQYMSPENISGDPVTHHVDLYAAGLIMYEMLTAEPAFTGDDPQAVMVAHIKDPPPRVDKEPHLKPFARVLAASLKKQPDERIPTARHMRELILTDFPQPEPREGFETIHPEPAATTSLIKPLAAIAVAASVVILLLILVLLDI